MREISYEILYPAGGMPAHRAPSARGPLSAALYPASLVYETVSGRLRARRMARRRPLGIPAVVVSVGNLEVGGNGKTPLAMRLVNELSRRGHRPAYVSRGFKGAPERVGGTTILVPLSADPKLWPGTSVRLLTAGAGGLAGALGDEGAMVAWRCPGVPLAFSRDRRRAIRAVFAMFEPTHVVLDDAFQTWSVPRDVDVVLLDAERPLGNGRTLPAGSLRERPEALGRADIVGFNAIDGRDDLGALKDRVQSLAGRSMPVFGIRRALSFVDERTGTPAPDIRGPVAALSGIGRPVRFETSLLDKGLDVKVSLRYPDHYRYARSDVRRVDEILARRGIGTIVTTEKDWVKLRDTGPPSARLRLARVEIEIVGDDPLLACEKPQASPAVSL